MGIYQHTHTFVGSKDEYARQYFQFIMKVWKNTTDQWDTVTGLSPKILRNESKSESVSGNSH